MVTNLSAFPSSLTVIHVPDGDLKKHRASFFVNEDLKRQNCSGRVGLTLVPPTAATIAKFHQLYRTSDKNAIEHAVIELVKLCQSALMLFDKLEFDYADGLLCDVTERAINDWWLEIGSSQYNIEPHDGILGPTTVAGLLGLLMGARNRLHAVGAPVGKDAFDVESMKRGIAAFQKQQRVQRTRRLDRRTLERLQRATIKAANSDGYWNVPKAVKSTVAELSGKGGEMVMDVVGRRDRAGIAEIETCDMERFVQLVYGERGKWLWYGKTPKTARVKDEVGSAARMGEEKEGLPGNKLHFEEGQHGGFTWTARKSMADVMNVGKREQQHDEDGAPMDQDDGEGEDGIRGVLKRTSGFKEAKSGLGRFKGAVGLGGNQHHHHKHSGSKEESPQTPRSPRSPQAPRSPIEEPVTPTSNNKDQQQQQRRRPLMRRAQSSPISIAGSPQSPIKELRQQKAIAAESIPEQPVPEPSVPGYAAFYRQVTSKESKESFLPPSYTTQDANGEEAVIASDQGSESVTIDAEPSVAGSIYNNVDLNDTLPQGPETEQDVGRLLRRTLSHSHFIAMNLQTKSEDAYPRHLSFSLVEESVLTWEDVVDRDTYFSNDTRVQLEDEEFIAKESRHLHSLISQLETSAAEFTQHQLQTLTLLLSKLESDQSTLEQLYRSPADNLHSLQNTSDGILRAERERLEEGSKEIETLAAKLEYEINGLKGRLEDVEAGVGDFEKGVGRVEERVGWLEKEGEKDEKRGWCVVM